MTSCEFSIYALRYGDLRVVIGFIMIVTGLYVAVNSLRPRNKRSDSDNESILTKSTDYFAVLGAALSPDLSILPICLVAFPLGLITMMRTLVIFAVSSILTDLLLVTGFSVLFSRAIDKLPSKYNDALVGLVVAAVARTIRITHIVAPTSLLGR